MLRICSPPMAPTIELQLERKESRESEKPVCLKWDITEPFHAHSATPYPLLLEGIISYDFGLFGLKYVFSFKKMQAYQMNTETGHIF